MAAFELKVQVGDEEGVGTAEDRERFGADLLVDFRDVGDVDDDRLPLFVVFVFFVGLVTFVGALVANAWAVPGEDLALEDVVAALDLPCSESFCVYDEVRRHEGLNEEPDVIADFWWES